MAKETVKLRDVLARDLSERIDPVVKVYDLETLCEDLRQFVITDSLAREIRKFLDAFTESLERRIRGGDGGDAMAVWIAGFFGSGKSHLAKVLGYLLQNDVVESESNETAIDIFNVHLDDPSLPGAKDLKALLAEVKNHAWCKTIAFEIKSRLDQANPESVTEACLRSFYRGLGLSETIWLARLERRLMEDGRYKRFVDAYEDDTGRSWIEDRPEHGFYGEEIAVALSGTLDRPIESVKEMVATYQRDHSRVTAENLADEISTWLEAQAEGVKPREPHLIFVIDEMGQFIGDSDDRIHELQAIVEQAGVKGRGRIWFICTSQEALDKVVDRTGLRLSMLGKLDARFSTKIPLTGEDVRRVVHQRLLRKREAKVKEVESLYKQNEGKFEDLCRLAIERHLASLESESFIESYPFLPLTIPLVQELFNAMRGFKLSGSERSMIDVTQGALIKLATQPLGVLTPLDVIFDQAADELSSADYLGSMGIKLIRESDKRIPDTPVPPSRILKTLWLISRVEWVPRNPETISRLMADHIDVNLPKLRDDVKATLDALQKAGIVGRDEATGQYRYLSEQERGIEEEIIDKIRDYGIGVAKRRAADLLKQWVVTRSKFGNFKIQLGKSGVIPFSVYLDGEPISSGGEIRLDTFGPLFTPKVEEIEHENLAKGVKGRTLWWLAGEEENLVEKLKRIEALEKVPEQPKWRDDRSDETVRVIKEKEKEKASLESHVAGLMEVCLLRGNLYYAGDQAELDGTKEFKAVTQELVGVVARNLYHLFDVADKRFNEANIPQYLNPGTKRLDRLDPELGLFDAQGHLLRNSPLVEAIYDELERRQDEAMEIEGKVLADHFERIPFGWPDAIIRLVLAAMLRGGAIHLQPADTGQPIYDIGDPQVEGLFTKPTRFRKTRFFPTVGGLTPEEVKDAKDGLIAIGETSLPDTAHGLTDRIRKVGNVMVVEAKTIEARVRDMGFPLPEIYQRAEPVVGVVIDQRDPVYCVRSFLEARDAWKEIADFLAAYRDFVEHKRDRSYRAYIRLLDYARAWPPVFEDDTGTKAKEQLGEFDAIVAAKEIISKWKPLQQAALVVIDRYRSVYKDTYALCSKAIAELDDEIKGAEPFTRLEKARQRTVIDAFFGQSSALTLPKIGDLKTPEELLEASEQRKLSELDALIKAVPSYRIMIFELCDREWGSQLAKKKKPREIKVHRFSLREHLLGKRFASKKEFQSTWSEIGKEIEGKIDEGYEVAVEE